MNLIGSEESAYTICFVKINGPGHYQLPQSEGVNFSADFSFLECLFAGHSNVMCNWYHGAFAHVKRFCPCCWYVLEPVACTARSSLIFINHQKSSHIEFQTCLQVCLSKTASKTEILSQDSTDPVDFCSTYIFTCHKPNYHKFQD